MPTSGFGRTFELAAALAYVYRRPYLAAGLFLVALGFSPYVVAGGIMIILIELVLFEKKKWRQSLLSGGLIAAVLASYVVIQKFITLKSTRVYDRPLEVTAGGGLASRLQAVASKLYQVYGEVVNYQPGHLNQHQTLLIATLLVLGSLAVIALLFWRKQYRLARVALLAGAWIPTSVLLFSTLNTVSTDAAFPSRYLYTTSIGLSLLLATLLVGLLTVANVGQRSAWVVGGAVLAGLLAFYLPKTQTVLTKEVALGSHRQAIMQAVDQSVAKPLPGAALFCFTSNASHYREDPAKIPLPFVHNFSFNLAVTYRANEPLFREFFDEGGIFLNPAASFYWYRKTPTGGIGPGLGFATNLEECARLKADYSFLNEKNIYGFAYDGFTGKLTDISQPLGQYLNGDQSVRDQLYPWPHTWGTDGKIIQNVYTE
jgi:hypothetical protein